MSVESNIERFKATMAKYQTDPRPISSSLIDHQLFATAKQSDRIPDIVVANEDVVARMAKVPSKSGVMNFASPTNPGGGVEIGANAQEEAICRNTYLYPELLKFKQNYYLPNQRHPNQGLYTRHFIYSRAVPVVFDEAGHDLHDRTIDIVTINAPDLTLGDDPSPEAVRNDLAIKILMTLRAFKEENVQYPILGAFGCGVFGNDPNEVVALFKESLLKPEFMGVFKTIYFSIYDPSERIITPFIEAFS